MSFIALIMSILQIRIYQSILSFAFSLCTALLLLCFLVLGGPGCLPLTLPRYQSYHFIPFHTISYLLYHFIFHFSFIKVIAIFRSRSLVLILSSSKALAATFLPPISHLLLSPYLFHFHHFCLSSSSLLKAHLDLDLDLQQSVCICSSQRRRRHHVWSW